MKNKYSFGYPKQCTDCCKDIGGLDNTVEPFYLENTGGKKIMLIGQDPTVSNPKTSVKVALMLDVDGTQKNDKGKNIKKGALRKWVEEELKIRFETNTIYATNVVKCRFEDFKHRDKHLKNSFMKNCEKYLKNELLNYEPDVVITFGEPAHQLFISILENTDVPKKMGGALFGGKFFRARYKKLNFDYSPCLHISTFRTANKYGWPISRFKSNLAKMLGVADTSKKDLQKELCDNCVGKILKSDTFEIVRKL
ncbi:MAG: uracil-DNA glycosylase family protein [Deltaproteobacteria bacterium]|nr:uracil-DNA glycosylase family protein [Deltaproteobacteria bacterium]